MSTRERPTTQDGWARYGWIMGAIWLVFLVYPALALVGSEEPSWARALGWFGLIMFGASYLAGFIRGMRDPLGVTSNATRVLFWVSLVCALLAAPAIGWNTLGFIPFLMSYSSYLLSRRWHWSVNILGPVVVVTYVVASGANSQAQPWGLMWIVLMIALVNSVNSWLIRRSARSDGLRLELATSEERESVARDVHDLLGHSLTVVKLKAELASRLIDKDPAAARAELDQIVHLTSEALAGVRGTVTGLRDHSLAEQLVASADALRSAGIAIEIRGEPTAFSPAQAIPAAWILREATTNILRHSGAKLVRVTLAPGTLVVEDDGRGAAPDPAPPEAPGPLADGPLAAGNGIRGMGERAAASGADLRIGAARPHGTKVSLTW